MLDDLIIDTIYSIVTLLYGSVFTLLFLDIKLTTRKNLITFALFSILIFVVQCLIGYFVSVDTVISFYPLIVHLPLFLFCTIYHRKNVLTTLTSIMLCYFLTSPRYLLAEIIVAVFPMIPFPDSIGKILASFILTFPIYKYMVPVIIGSFKRNTRDIMHFFIPLIFVYTLSYLLYVYTDLLATNSILMMEIMFTLFFFIILYYLHKYFISIDNMIEKGKRNQILALSTESIKKQLDILNENNEQTKILRHDIRHYATMVKQLAEAGNMEKVVHISEEIEAKNHALITKQYCSNPWINLLLNAYIYQFENAGANPILKISVPSEIFINEMDLCVILGNILDNAIRSVNACKEKLFCSIILHYDLGKLYLEVQNSCESPVSFQDETPLSTRNGHGYGCKSIEYIAEKYHGICSFELHENIFSTRIILHEQ